VTDRPTTYPLAWPHGWPRAPITGRYFVTRDGRVLSNARGEMHEMAQHPDKDGYPCVLLSDGTGRRVKYRVHRAVIETFVGPMPRPGMEVRHLDGVKPNNDVSNLAWGTQRDNADDRERHGRTARGQRNGAYSRTATAS
jgi:hypothetical protein